MRRTAQHPRLAAALASAALTGAVAASLAGCQTGSATPAASSSTTTSAAASSSSAPATSSSSSSSSPAAEPSAGATAGPNQLTAPTEGATVQGPQVTVTGQGTAFEATLLWQVVSQGTGDVVQQGQTTAGANGDVGPFSFGVTLDPGVYTVQVWEPSMKDGADGEKQNLVSASFTVVA